MPSTEEQVRRKARVLAAWLSPQEAQGFAQSFVLDVPTFQAEWRARTASLPTLPTGYTAPRIEDLPPAGVAHVQQLTAKQNFAAIYPAAEFKLIELGKLLAYQHWMDTDVSDGVHGAGTASVPTDDEVLSRCLPLDIIPASRNFWNAVPMAEGVSLSVYSHNNTLAFEFAADQATNEVRIVIHAGANLMLVQEHAGRYVLANGYHRAWWLRSRGVEMVPVVLTHVGPEHLNRPGLIPYPVLMGDRPPTVDHFLNEAVSLTVDVRAMLRVVRISAETLLVPRLL